MYNFALTILQALFILIAAPWVVYKNASSSQIRKPRLRKTRNMPELTQQEHDRSRIPTHAFQGCVAHHHPTGSLRSQGHSCPWKPCPQGEREYKQIMKCKTLLALMEARRKYSLFLLAYSCESA